MPFVNYVRSLNLEKHKNLFFLPWRSVIIRNNEDGGNLMLPTNLESYHPTKKCMWVELKCAAFKDEGGPGVFGMLVCTTCISMQGILSLAPCQNKEVILAKRCHHAQAFMMLHPEWEREFDLPEDLEDGPSNLFRLPALKSKLLRGDVEDKLFLAVVQQSGVLSLLHTISRQMKQPVCSRCSTCPCPCLKYMKGVEGARKRGRDDEEQVEEDEVASVELPWSRKRKKKNPVEHFENEVALPVWYEEYGCNRQEILFPISRDPVRSKTWRERLGGKTFSPDAEGLCAEPDLDASCHAHGHPFKRDCKVKTSNSIVIYNAQSEKVFDSPTFGCGTGLCRCIFQLDGDPYQLWHIRRGCFIEYTYIHSYILRHLSSGIPVAAEYAARKSTLTSLGLETSLTATEFQHAVAGFRALLRFPPDAFSCPTCSRNPAYIVLDGTDLGPAASTVQHLTELEKPSSNDPLPQGGFFEDRTFLPSFQERDMVCNLITEALDIEDFCDADFSTEGGVQVQELVRRLRTSGLGLSPAYKRFLANVSKETSVAGLLQVTCKEPLSVLRRFCQRDLDLTKINNSASLSLLREEIPPFLSMLEDIRKEEKSNFLPPDVSSIVLTILRIRERTFSYAERRATTDYTEWDEPADHPTSFYPDFPLRCYPQTYETR